MWSDRTQEPPEDGTLNRSRFLKNYICADFIPICSEALALENNQVIQSNGVSELLTTSD